MNTIIMWKVGIWERDNSTDEPTASWFVEAETREDAKAMVLSNYRSLYPNSEIRRMESYGVATTNRFYPQDDE